MRYRSARANDTPGNRRVERCISTPRRIPTHRASSPSPGGSHNRAVWQDHDRRRREARPGPRDRHGLRQACAPVVAVARTAGRFAEPGEGALAQVTSTWGQVVLASATLAIASSRGVGHETGRIFPKCAQAPACGPACRGDTHGGTATSRSAPVRHDPPSAPPVVKGATGLRPEPTSVSSSSAVRR
jgi:hypothetical protein